MISNMLKGLKALIPNSPKKAVLDWVLLSGLYGLYGCSNSEKPKDIVCKDGVCRISAETAKPKRLEQRIVYTSIYEGNMTNKREINTCDINGKNEKKLTFNQSLDDNPSFSPDGKTIIFNSLRDKNYEIYIMDNDGKNQKNLTNSLRNEMCPKFSPDGKKIIFNSNNGKYSQLYQMNIDGSNIEQLTLGGIHHLDGFYSPKGDRIIYTSDDGGGNADLSLLDLKKKKEIILLKDVNPFGCFPKWSLDGRKIVFNKGWINKEGYAKMQVCLYDLKTKKVEELTDGSFEDGEPSFTPDEKKILFYSNRNGVNYEIYQMDADGRNIKKLTTGGKYKNKPVMSPLTVFNDSLDKIALEQESKDIEIKEIAFPEIKNDNIESVLKTKGTVIVDAYTVWCGPCKHYSKNILGPASQKYKNVRFMKVDAEKNREISRQYGINAYPTTLIFKDGKFIESFVGADGGKLEETIKKYSK